MQTTTLPTTLQTTNDSISRFAALFQQGCEAWIEAGKIVSDAMDQDPDFPLKVNAAHPHISCNLVYAFDRLGRKELHVKLMNSEAPGVRRLKCLPYAVQEKFVNHPLPLLIKAEGRWDTLNVSVFNLTPDQAAQVFDSDGVRSEAAQRAWLESKYTKVQQIPVQVDDPPYKVGKGRVIFLKPCEITTKQLARLLSEME